MSEQAYVVNVGRSAQKEIRALDGVLRTRIVQSIRSLAIEPRPHGCRKLVGATNRWRIRIGDYRVIYSINDGEHFIEIITVRHRSKAYE